MMYRCKICDTVFDEPALVEDSQWHSEVQAFEKMYFGLCPVCGTEEYEEIDLCRICGEPLHRSDEKTCAKCSSRVRRAITKFVRELETNGYLEEADDQLDGASLEEFL